jgi:F-type H+-transporting ATPase subunit b
MNRCHADRFGTLRGFQASVLFGAIALCSGAFAEEPAPTEAPREGTSAEAVGHAPDKSKEPPAEHAKAPAPEATKEAAAAPAKEEPAAHAVEPTKEPEHVPAPAAHATEQDKAHATEDHHPPAGEHHAAGEHGAGHGEHAGNTHHGVQNWWSWDYGPNAKDPAHKDLPPPFGFALINFAIFFGIMMKLAGRPIREMVKSRHETIRKDLDEAAKLRKLAQAKLEEYGNKVKDVESEVAALIAQIRKEAEADKARIIAAAEEQARKIKSDAERQMAAEVARASAELRREVIDVAVASAEEMLKKQIGADDQRKMAEKYVVEVERTGRSS